MKTCICGMEIRPVDIKDGFEVWLDAKGSPFCVGTPRVRQHRPEGDPTTD